MEKRCQAGEGECQIKVAANAMNRELFLKLCIKSPHLPNNPVRSVYFIDEETEA